MRLTKGKALLVTAIALMAVVGVVAAFPVHAQTNDTTTTTTGQSSTDSTLAYSTTTPHCANMTGSLSSSSQTSTTG